MRVVAWVQSELDGEARRRVSAGEPQLERDAERAADRNRLLPRTAQLGLRLGGRRPRHPGLAAQPHDDGVLVRPEEDYPAVDAHLIVDLGEGPVTECREVDVITNLDERGYGFVITGEYDDWKDLVGGEAGIIDQLMGGVMELDGDMQKILQYSDAAVRLTDIAADTESRFLF